jgi:hypothetical protein
VGALRVELREAPLQHVFHLQQQQQRGAGCTVGVFRRAA